MNDTATTVKLRWEVRTTTVYEAEVPVDQLPDRLVWNDDDDWGIEEGDVDHYEVRDFLEALDGAGSAMEQSLTVDGYTVLDADTIPPVLVAAAPVSAIDARFPDDEIPDVPQERFAEYAEEATAVTGITECERLGIHQRSERHTWHECPLPRQEGDIE
ncbi:MAG: hypothetical protein ABWY36_05400 [Leifsonia sp.]